MHFTVYTSTIDRYVVPQVATPLVALLYAEEEPMPAALAELLEADDFGGQSNQDVMLYPRGSLPPRRLLLLGMGKRAKLTGETLRVAGARAARQARRLKLHEFALVLPAYDHLAWPQTVQALVEGIELGLYRYPDMKSHHEEEPHTVDSCTLVVAAGTIAGTTTPDIAAVLAPHVARAQSSARGVMRARDLVNAPGNVLTPARMAEIAHEIGTAAGMQARSLGRAELEQEGFGGLLAVAQGSVQEPRFIILEYTPPNDPDTGTYPPICLVGKGITFDTGGISLKPGANMDAMKMDMGGAAAVLGAMQAIGEWQPPLRVVALISAAENMPSGSAFKPGDVITTLSGKTIEVLNTDAEGRVVLADALTYARRYDPAVIIDLATLTGSARVALGAHATAVLGNDQAIIDRLLAAGEYSGERLWQLPLWDAYREMVKSEIADVRNTGGGRDAGTITAAALLDAFVGDCPWAHLDIAATAWTDGDASGYQTSGATGVGVRVLLQFLRDWTQE